MRFIIFAVILLTAVPTIAIERPTEFREIKWGTLLDDIGDVDSFEYVDQSGDEDVYVKNDDNLAIAGEPVNKIDYIFIDDIFVGVDIEFSNSASNSIYAALRKKYGKPSSFEQTGSGTNYYWKARYADEANISLISSENAGMLKMRAKMKDGSGL